VGTARVERRGYVGLRPRPARRYRVSLHRVTSSLAILLLIIVGMGGVLLSPLLLSRIDALGDADWSRLSEIGQTYGAASAILALVALGGVTASLFLQARETKAANIQTVRQFHFELTRMELDNIELYLPCWGPLNVSTIQGKQRILYTNQVMNYLRMAYEIGAFTERSFRGVLRNMFEGEVGRNYWMSAQDSWAEIVDSRQLRRFIQVVNEEYQKAVAKGPPVPVGSINDTVRKSTDLQPSFRVPKARRGKEAWRFPAGTLVGFASGLAIGELLRRRRRR
jgi:hypothetical protein